MNLTSINKIAGFSIQRPDIILGRSKKKQLWATSFRRIGERFCIKLENGDIISISNYGGL